MSEKLDLESGYGDGNWRIMMANSGMEMFFLRWGLFIVAAATFFLAVPWTTVIYQEKWASRVEIDGKTLKFTGSAGEFFMVFTTCSWLSFIEIIIPNPPYLPSVSRIDLLKLSAFINLEYGSKESIRPVTAAISRFSLLNLPSDFSNKK